VKHWAAAVVCSGCLPGLSVPGFCVPGVCLLGVCLLGVCLLGVCLLGVCLLAADLSCSIGRSISLLGISPHLFLSPRLETDAVVGAAPTAWVARIAKGEEDEGGSSSPPRASHPETSLAHLSPAETTRTQAAPARQALPMDGRFSREFSVSTISVVPRVTPGM